jgi:hypothetical protein
VVVVWGVVEDSVLRVCGAVCGLKSRKDFLSCFFKRREKARNRSEGSIDVRKDGVLYEQHDDGAAKADVGRCERK